MASLFPLISELLPMVMPAEAHIVRADDVDPGKLTANGNVLERPGVVGKCPKMCTSGLPPLPHTPPCEATTLVS